MTIQELKSAFVYTCKKEAETVYFAPGMLTSLLNTLLRMNVVYISCSEDI
jgi:hypothetical protein